MVGHGTHPHRHRQAGFRQAGRHSEWVNGHRAWLCQAATVSHGWLAPPVLVAGEQHGLEGLRHRGVARRPVLTTHTARQAGTHARSATGPRFSPPPSHGAAALPLLTLAKDDTALPPFPPSGWLTHRHRCGARGQREADPAVEQHVLLRGPAARALAAHVLDPVVDPAQVVGQRTPLQHQLTHTPTDTPHQGRDERGRALAPPLTWLDQDHHPSASSPLPQPQVPPTCSPAWQLACLWSRGLTSSMVWTCSPPQPSFPNTSSRVCSSSDTCRHPHRHHQTPHHRPSPFSQPGSIHTGTSALAVALKATPLS